jgi:hypothetical protein
MNNDLPEMRDDAWGTRRVEWSASGSARFYIGDKCVVECIVVPALDHWSVDVRAPGRGYPKPVMGVIGWTHDPNPPHSFWGNRHIAGPADEFGTVTVMVPLDADSEEVTREAGAAVPVETE